jgi:hypothetical protein
VFEYSHHDDRAAHVSWLSRIASRYQTILSPAGRSVGK